MSGAKETPQYPPEIKPVRVGVYRTEFFDRWLERGRGGFSWWDGARWGFQCSTPERASERRYGHGAVQEKRWCGLAEDPDANAPVVETASIGRRAGSVVELARFLQCGHPHISDRRALSEAARVLWRLAHGGSAPC